ncbi:hypothetical protein G6F63_016533 [Rhizopus arrhizus]|nr:hypothetical protein G6F63_016533 [Rhizopus arrhizus]
MRRRSGQAGETRFIPNLAKLGPGLGGEDPRLAEPDAHRAREAGAGHHQPQPPRSGDRGHPHLPGTAGQGRR